MPEICQHRSMQPMVREFVVSVMSLAVAQTKRARANFHPDYEDVSFRAEVSGPISGDGVLGIDVFVTLTPTSEEREVEQRSVRVTLDVPEQRVLADALRLPELPLDLSTLQWVTEGLESWCAAQIPREQPLG